jgi:integrase
MGKREMNPEKGDANAALLSLTGEEEGQTRARIQSDPQVISLAFWLRKQGLAEKTIEAYCRMLRLLVERHADLNDPESVKEALARSKASEQWKALAIAAYSSFLKMRGLTWIPPKVNIVRKLPFIPLEEELDALIAGCGPKTSTLLQLLKETGMRIGEALRLKWSDVDFQRRVIILNQPEKHGRARVFTVSDKLAGMLKALPRVSENVFQGGFASVRKSFYASRRRLAEKLNNPRLNMITFHTFRHWKATMEYHKTKDPLHVKELLGHKSLDTTLLYIQVEEALFQSRDDEFTVKTARDPEEIKSLLEVGFEYVCEKDGLMFFRKRK